MSERCKQHLIVTVTLARSQTNRGKSSLLCTLCIFRLLHLTHAFIYNFVTPRNIQKTSPFVIAVSLKTVNTGIIDVTCTSKLANKAEITILSARDTTRAWVPSRGIMGRNVGVYKTGYNTWLSSRLQNKPRSFRFVLFNFNFFSLFSSFFFRYYASSLVGSAVLISFL